MQTFSNDLLHAKYSVKQSFITLQGILVKTSRKKLAKFALKIVFNCACKNMFIIKCIIKYERARKLNAI